MLFINARDAEYVKPAAVGPVQDAKVVVIATVIFFVVLYLHPYISGVKLIAG